MSVHTEGGLTVAPLSVSEASYAAEHDPETKLPPGKKPEKAEDKTGPPPSRSSLRVSATWWRSLQRAGMSLHWLAWPRPPNPSFSRSIPSTLSRMQGHFSLQFYLPKSFSTAQNREKTYPAVINFHGGGFTLGSGTDDARFARFVLDKCDAVFVSVDYRLAPEYPFPTAVDDGADAILYLVRNAHELRIDASRLATSGFSAGGNIAITALLRLFDHRSSQPAAVPNYRIAATATWYPIIDYTLTRAERRASAKRPDLTLSPALTTLFDASYLYPPDLNLNNPLLSPAKSSDDYLIHSLPSNVIFYTCEWDMLLREGEQFAARLGSPSIGKTVHYYEIPRVAHGWDKGPSPLRPPERSEKLYGECCVLLKSLLNGENNDERVESRTRP
jgi:putative ergosteryl-3beta-O-L-aspartate hydrolase